MVAKLNFVRNIIDLGTIAVDELTAWMDPRQSSFKYPGNRLLLSVASSETKGCSN